MSTAEGYTSRTLEGLYVTLGDQRLGLLLARQVGDRVSVDCCRRGIDETLDKILYRLAHR